MRKKKGLDLKSLNGNSFSNFLRQDTLMIAKDAESEKGFEANNMVLYDSEFEV